MIPRHNRLNAWLFVVSLLCVASLGTALAGAAFPAVGFEAANRLYEEGRFSDAAAAYEQLLHGGRASAPLYFNLGNAFFKSGSIGKALAAYREAAALAPRDPDIRANLQFARNQVQGPSFKPAFWKRWLSQFSLNEWSVLVSVMFWLLFLALALRQLRPALRPALKRVTLALAIGTLLTGTALTSLLWDGRENPTAVIAARDVTVRRGPLDESQTAFTLHDGAEVRILDRDQDWVQVSTDARRVGWLKRESLAE